MLVLRPRERQQSHPEIVPLLRHDDLEEGTPLPQRQDRGISMGAADAFLTGAYAAAPRFRVPKSSSSTIPPSPLIQELINKRFD